MVAGCAFFARRFRRIKTEQPKASNSEEGAFEVDWEVIPEIQISISMTTRFDQGPFAKRESSLVQSACETTMP